MSLEVLRRRANSLQGTAYAFTRPGPSVSIASPQNGATYTQGQVVDAAFSCSDPADGPGLASCTGTVPNGSPINTSTAGTHTFTAIATDNADQQASQTVSYTVVLPRPVISRAHQSHKRWRLGNRLARISRKRPPVGTTFSFAPNEGARVRFAFTQRVAGRRVGGRCVAQTKRNRNKRKCTRIVTVGTLSFNGHAGVNKVRLQGRLSRHKRLKPGRYTLVITATNTTGSSKPVNLKFTIVG